MPIQLQVERAELPKPEWLRIKPPTQGFADVKATVKSLGLHTVCQSAHCPNISECWSGGTATFLVLGNTCTRGCRFCAVPHGIRGDALDSEEPAKLALAVRKWGLDYVVITSVDRDDLPDQGAGHFAQCILELRSQAPGVLAEVLIPDFRGRKDLIAKIAEAKPAVIAHNIETVRELQGGVRDPRANYGQSLSVLAAVKELDPAIFTKSSIMLGLGETEAQLAVAFEDLRSAGCDFLTLGQYLRPSSRHLPVAEYVPPGKFEYLRQLALKEGFRYVAAGPFVRSSYRSGEFFAKSLLGK
ncbi:lipoyl synthase [Candidatus Micrarchaeota archaeon]|nr:lipoyl synthase [Candidatus Micrarchaeota archaeon]MBI5176539.1 lipoyl synthase [Candidatus Micrarchaeota archaeon]